MNSLNDLWTSNALIQAAGLPGQNCPDSTLYIVGLPIGNLGDITLRALWILALADVVAAEDTRETRKLLDKFGISVKLLSVREHNERHGAEQIIELLQEGKKVTLVTDAGTPCVSDPGARAVKAVREAGFRVIPVPGASAARRRRRLVLPPLPITAVTPGLIFSNSKKFIRHSPALYYIQYRVPCPICPAACRCKAHCRLL